MIDVSIFSEYFGINICHDWIYQITIFLHFQIDLEVRDMCKSKKADHVEPTKNLNNQHGWQTNSIFLHFHVGKKSSVEYKKGSWDGHWLSTVSTFINWFGPFCVYWWTDFDPFSIPIRFFIWNICLANLDSFNRRTNDKSTRKLLMV